MSENSLEIQHAQAHDHPSAADRQGYGLTISLGWNRMLIHRKTIRALGHPERVRLLINPGTRHLCIQGCDEKEACSFAVPRDLTSFQDSFYIHSKSLLDQLCALTAWNPLLSYRVFGKINTHTNVLDFDLNRYMEVNLTEFLENDEVPEAFMNDYRSPAQSAQEETPAPETPAAQGLCQPPLAAPEPTKPLPGRFMGGLFDSVRIPGRKADSDD